MPNIKKIDIQKIKDFVSKNLLLVGGCFLVLVLIVAGIVFATNDDSDGKEEKTEVVSSIIENESIITENYALKILGVVENYSTVGFEKPSDGNQFIKVLFDLRNSGEKELTYQKKDFVIKDKKDKEYKCELLRVDISSDAEGKIAKGGYVQGFLVFEPPKDIKEHSLVYEPKGGEVIIKVSLDGGESESENKEESENSEEDNSENNEEEVDSEVEEGVSEESQAEDGEGEEGEVKGEVVSE